MNAGASMAEVVLEITSLRKKYPVYGRLNRLLPPVSHIHAVRDVSLTLREGETYGMVGESGSGKTTVGRLIAGLTPADGGSIRYRGQELLGLSKKGWARHRGDIQFVFQDPFSSLDPRQKAGEILEEALVIHRMGGPEERRKQVLETLEMAGLRQEHYFRRPHEFSGGQQQRLSIARALIINPNIIICDEPVSALDVSIQSQILNILMTLQRKMKLALLFITHDIRVVRHISDRIGVMYLGTIVEEAATEELFSGPRHPYTRALFSAVPDFSRDRLTDRIILSGEIPAHTGSPQGCVFQSRCPQARDLCKKIPPPAKKTGTDHYTACHFPL
jgi:oligopeptide transport system ATP-binding protein